MNESKPMKAKPKAITQDSAVDALRTVEDLPYSVDVVEHTWIPLSDGCRLSARMWIPKGAEKNPLPAILEYIPYRKRDHTRPYDEQNFNYLAGHGYACLRVDMRGSGDSEGVLEDEYLKQEQDDGVEILHWIGSRPWCNGKVGMMGISWGGFNALQIAARRPPELAAIITVCSTDDRYADDVHYMGGCLLGDNLSWASIMFNRNAQPPDPLIVGDDWRKMWLQRLAKSGLWVEKWMRHQRRDDYWKHGSICEDYSAVRCPVYAVGGWADGYTNAIFRLLENLETECKGLVGPWSHVYPHWAKPGPAIGFLQESLRWWDHWLKGQDTGIMKEPKLTVWMQSHAPPAATVDYRPGRWVTLEDWPCPDIIQKDFPLDKHRIGRQGEVTPQGAISFQSPLSVGLLGGKWCSYLATPDLPHDQRDENGGAVVFESAPLEEDIEILGAPVLELDLSSDQPTAMIAVRLSDVAPDDKETRVTYGVLNLTHRNGHAEPEPLETDRRYHVRVRLNQIAQQFRKGHRLNLAVSSSYWPIVWPSPHPARLTLHTGNSRLLLPVCKEQGHLENEDEISFAPPEVGPARKPVMVAPPKRNWVIVRDMAADETSIVVTDDAGTVCHRDIDLEIEARSTERFSYTYDNLSSLRGETRWHMRFKREDWQVSTYTHTILTATESHFRVQAVLDAYEGESRVFSQSWDRWIPRDHM
jgi:hypothetical protein